MGINSGVLEILASLQTAGLIRPKASVVEIGAQQLDNSFLKASERINGLGLQFGIDHPLTLPPARPTYIVHGELEHLDPEAPPARLFWNWLGFDYAAIDIDGSPGSIPLDLNYDSVPPGSVGKHHLVTNFGTTEHVANQLNAFKVIHDLTTLGGLMIHQLPAQGMFNHGLINYNFKFFWMLARSNDYRFVYANYAQGVPYDLPKNIADFVVSLNSTVRRDDLRYSAADGGLTVIMQKTLDIPFVSPLDVATGAKTDIAFLKQRYWTVFDPRALRRVRKERAQAPKQE